MTYKYWELEIDGPDKTGKDLLCRYLCEMSQYRFSINVRGLMSQLVYAKKFGRDDTFDTSTFSKNKVLILLSAEPDDLAIRCKLTNEPEYDYKSDEALFDKVADELFKSCFVLRYNTSVMTPYVIAKDIIRYIDRMEGAGKNGKIS